MTLSFLIVLESNFFFVFIASLREETMIIVSFCIKLFFKRISTISCLLLTKQGNVWLLFIFFV